MKVKRFISIATCLFLFWAASMNRSFDALAPLDEMSTIACYLALANDLTPLFDAGAPDAAAASPECASEFCDRETNVM